jgi:hypothetical protein
METAERGTDRDVLTADDITWTLAPTPDVSRGENVLLVDTILEADSYRKVAQQALHTLHERDREILQTLNRAFGSLILHPTNSRKLDALETFTLGRTRAESENDADGDSDSVADSLGNSGGPQEDRTPDLRIANAALSQLS